MDTSTSRHLYCRRTISSTPSPLLRAALIHRSPSPPRAAQWRQPVLTYLPATQKYPVNSVMADGIYDAKRDVYYFMGANQIPSSLLQCAWQTPIAIPEGSYGPQRLVGLALSPASNHKRRKGLLHHNQRSGNWRYGTLSVRIWQSHVWVSYPDGEFRTLASRHSVVPF